MQTILITGVNGFLGSSLAQTLMKRGDQVIGIDLADESSVDINKYIQSDLADHMSFTRIVTALEEYDSIDGLINNAASKSSDPAFFFNDPVTYKYQTWREVMQINLDAPYFLTMALIEKLRKSGNSSVINISSIYGLVGPDNRLYEGAEYMGHSINSPAVYSASKAGLIGLTKWMATTLAPKYGIRANCVVPGGIDTGQNDKFKNSYSMRVPLKRMAQTEEIVNPLLNLISTESNYINGHTLVIDGGLTAW
jgi:NAD(P)-dependent dehydrogenase (short-subunit alcohol dehydrogenase family)